MKKPENQQGFSLVELMIAMVVLTIGIMATMSMQFTSLAGYTAARETTGATELARAVEQRIRAESLAWQPGEGIPSGIDPLYFDQSLLDLVNTGAWELVNEEPVSVQFNEMGPRRFCAFVRGSVLVDQAAAENMELLAVTIAVVYPGANSSIPGQGAGNLWGDCTQIDPEVLRPDDTDPLELLGLRATFVSTTMTPRG